METKQKNVITNDTIIRLSVSGRYNSIDLKWAYVLRDWIAGIDEKGLPEKMKSALEKGGFAHHTKTGLTLSLTRGKNNGH